MGVGKRAVSEMAAQVDPIKGVGGYLRHTESQARPPRRPTPHKHARTHQNTKQTPCAPQPFFFSFYLFFLSLIVRIDRWVCGLRRPLGLCCLITYLCRRFGLCCHFLCLFFPGEVWLVHIFLCSRRVSRSRFDVCWSLLNCCACSDSANATSSL